MLQTEGDDRGVDVCSDLFIIRDIGVDDDRTAVRRLGCKLMERSADIVDILEEVQMVFFDI